jgi:hypothetical protein
MTKLQIKELLKQHHPHLSSKLSDMYLELSADKIAQETDIITKTLLISSVAGQRWYDLDASITEIDKVYFNDVKIPKLIGDPIIDDDEITIPVDSADTALSTPSANASNKRYWSFSKYDSSSSTSKTYRIGILEKVANSVTRDGRTSDFQSCSITGTNNIRLYVKSTASKFANTDDATTSTVGPLKDIPEQFHETILNGAIARGYKDPTNFKSDMFQFFNNEFELGIKAIKRFSRTKTGTGFIRPQSF